MAEVSAQMVKELREMTGVGMMECKKALVETDGNIDAAVDILRARGLAAVAKKAGRATNEGLVAISVADDAKTAAMVEVNCETDFVSRNEVFAGYVNKIAKAALENDCADIDALKTAEVDGETVEEVITAAIHQLGENIQLARIVRKTVASGAIVSYLHGGGRIGVMVEFGFANAATAASDDFKTMGKDVAMQVTAANPGAVTRDGFAADVIEHEMAIYRAKAAQSGKPEAIQEKIAEGNLKKFYQDNALIEQAFVKDSDKTVQNVIDGTAKLVNDKIEVLGFERFEVGGA